MIYATSSHKNCKGRDKSAARHCFYEYAGFMHENTGRDKPCPYGYCLTTNLVGATTVRASGL